jgi:hypothetical protein
MDCSSLAHAKPRVYLMPDSWRVRESVKSNLEIGHGIPAEFRKAVEAVHLA